MSACESALSRLRTSLEEAILNETVETEFVPCYDDTYFAEVYVKFSDVKFYMTVAEQFICYHNIFIEGLFSEKKAFEEFKNLIRKHCKILTHEDKEKINALQQQIEDIKRGQA